MIELTRLTKHFDGFRAVDGVTLSVAPGEVLALLGPNGASKTTTIRVLAAAMEVHVTPAILVWAFGA